jgi:hypothetical protein
MPSTSLDTRRPQGQTRSGPAWCTTRPAEWRQLSSLGAVAALRDPLRDQRLVGAGHPAQLGHGLPSGLVLRALARSRAEYEPGDLGQQIATAACGLLQFCRSGGFFGFGQAAPPGVPQGNAGQASAEQSAAVGLVMISGHLTRIEHMYDKSKPTSWFDSCEHQEGVN